MSESSIERTTSTLLVELLDPENQSVWREFDLRYRPILLAVAGRMGLSGEDAEEVTQETLVQFLRDYRQGKYDRSKGRLRAWIHGILRHRILDLHRKSGREAHRGESVLLQLPDEDHLAKAWDDECRKKIIQDALEELVRETDIRPETAEAFRLYALEEQPAQAVAEQLGIKLNMVYLAKHRCAKALKEIVVRLTSAYDD